MQGLGEKSEQFSLLTFFYFDFALKAETLTVALLKKSHFCKISVGKCFSNEELQNGICLLPC